MNNEQIKTIKGALLILSHVSLWAENIDQNSADGSENSADADAIINQVGRVRYSLTDLIKSAEVTQ